MPSARTLFAAILSMLLSEGALCAMGDAQKYDDVISEIYQSDQQLLDNILSSETSTAYELVSPVQLRLNEVLSNLDTRDLKSKTKDTHYHHTNFEIFLSGKLHKIKLELNRELLSSGLKQKRSSDASSYEYLHDEWIENCYYQGQIRKLPDSLVIVSTCRGIRGVIILPTGVFFIAPLLSKQTTNEVNHDCETTDPHVVYAVSTSLPAIAAKTCGNSGALWQSYQKLHFVEFLRNIKIMKPQEEELFSESRYIRLAIVIDHTLYKRLNGSYSDAISYVLLVSNIIDALLRELKLRVRLVYVDLWNDHDLIEVDPNIRTTLTSFFRYRQTAMKTASFHYAHLLTGRTFHDNEFGMSVQDSVCSNRSVAVSEVVLVSDPLRVAAQIVHLLGHTLGISHDPFTEECSCSDNGRCLMDWTLTATWPAHPQSWSTCSSKSFRQSVLSRLDNCLLTGEETSTTTFEQKCGNGVIERGEECDCLNQECELIDPCCDPTTCLLRPWATCRYGECCHNCTVRPSNQICRNAASECDVPEFCDGSTGICPSNGLVQDGQLCHGDGYCYRGVCQTHVEHCQDIWGTSATVADDQCYEMFNTYGRFDGHCGKDPLTGDYRRCPKESIKCGLLQCAQGAEQPIQEDKNWTFSTTSIVSHGNNYQCKAIIEAVSETAMDPSVMAPDGVKCGDDKICLAGSCVSLSLVMPATCTIGTNGKICSGNGVCTTDIRCFCSVGYTGSDCSKRTNVTFLPLILTTEFITPPTPSPSPPPTPFPIINTTEQTPLLIAPPSVVTFSSVIAHSGQNRNSMTTLWLIIVLASVVVAACVLLAFCVVCYSRKSPMMKKKTTSTIMSHKVVLHSSNKCGGSISSFSYSKSSDCSYDNTANRIISFGKTPSYRADKLRKALRGVAGASETDSEHSRGDRSSTEVKVISAPLPLGKTPEKGILKKYPRGVDDRRTHKETQLLRQIGSVDSSGETSEVKTLVRLEDEIVRNIRGSETALLHQDSVPPAHPRKSGYLEELGDKGRVIGDVNEDEESSCSCSDDASEEDLTSLPMDCNTGETVTSGRAASESSNDQQTQTDIDSPSDSCPGRRREGRVGDDRRGAREENNDEKTRFLADLLSQMESSLRRRAVTDLTSPVDLSQTCVSDDLPGSDTEVDRSLPRDSFYRQSDAIGRSAPVNQTAPLQSDLNVLSSLANQMVAQRLCDQTSSNSLAHPSSSSVSSNLVISPLSQPTATPLMVQPHKSPSNSIKLSRKQFFEPPPTNTTSAPLRSFDTRQFTPIQRINSTQQSSSRTTAEPMTSRNRSQPTSPGVSRQPLLSLANPLGFISSSDGHTSFHAEPKRTTPGTLTLAHSADNNPAGSLSASAAAVPYRGVTNSSSGSNSKTSSKSPLLDNRRRKSPEPLSSGPEQLLSDSVARPCRTVDGQLDMCEIHQGTNEEDKTIVICEIPTTKKSAELRFVPDSRGAYTKAPGSPGSPDDIDV